MTSNTTCLLPFLAEAEFPTIGGFIDGRFCSSALGESCCLPCPQTEWLYPDNFDTVTTSANWVNVAGLICCLFLLVSYAALPVAKTHRHFLSICLVIGIVFMQLGFVIPLGAKPDQCYNDITPNDMRSSKTCALSGAFLLLGGWSGVMWIFLRALALHLQICWQMVLGKSFMWGAIATGWGIPAIALTVALVFSGVSFRFGDTCHINHNNSLAGFWIPLLVFAGTTLVIQFATFGYCIKVYLASLADEATTTGSSGLPSYAVSARGTVSPRQAYRRVRRVLELQWRGIVIVLVIVTDVIFFAVIFVFLDDTETNLLKNPLQAEAWLACLIQSKGNKDQCLSLGEALVVNEATVMAVLYLLSVNGIWLLILLGRTSMFTAWWSLLRNPFSRSHPEFVSADVSNFKDPQDKNTGSYEMLGRSTDQKQFSELPAKPPLSPMSPIIPLSPTAQTSTTPMHKSGRETPDYFGREARYKSPSRSFSAPKAPSVTSNGVAQDWDPQRTYATPQQQPYLDPLSMNKI